MKVWFIVTRKKSYKQNCIKIFTENKMHEWSWLEKCRESDWRQIFKSSNDWKYNLVSSSCVIYILIIEILLLYLKCIQILKFEKQYRCRDIKCHWKIMSFDSKRFLVYHRDDDSFTIYKVLSVTSKKFKLLNRIVTSNKITYWF